MKKSTLLLLIGILLSPVFLLAQYENPAPAQDTVYLKAGGAMIGKVLRYHPKRGILLEERVGIYTTITSDAIQSIILRADAASKDKVAWKTPMQKSYDFRETGIYFTTMGSMLNGMDPGGDADLGFGVQATAGYMLHRWLGVGLGVGFDNYSIVNNNAPAIFPVSVEVRGYLTQQRWAPYYALNAGYGFAARDEERNIRQATGGAMLHPAFGLRLGAREDVNFAIDFGYRFQRATVERDFIWRQEVQEQRIWYKRFTIRFGIIF